MSYLVSSMLASPPHRDVSDLDFRQIISVFGKPSNSRLGPAEVPQPGIDLVNVAASACSRASQTVSTPKFEGLLLSCSVLVRNGRGDVAIQKARKEWNPPKEVLYPANIKNRDR